MRQVEGGGGREGLRRSRSEGAGAKDGEVGEGSYDRPRKNKARAVCREMETLKSAAVASAGAGLCWGVGCLLN
jgi:hypothetical protein